MRPLVTGSARLIRLKNVVLPAPLGPMMPVIDPASTAKSTSSTAHNPPNDFAQTLGLKEHYLSPLLLRPALSEADSACGVG